MNLKSRSGMAIIVLALTCLLLGSALAVLYHQHTTTMTAHIKSVGDFEVWFDEALTIPADSFDFGEFSVTEGSETKTVALWFKSKANTPLEISWIMTDADLTWESGASAGYNYPNMVDRNWMLSALVNGGAITWIPEVSTLEHETLTYVITLTAYDDVTTAVFELKAYQSLTFSVNLDFILTFSSHDTYA